MDAADKTFAGSIPEIYDRDLVPLIFQPYADDLAARIAALDPADVLETAAGTGALTRSLAAQLPAAVRIVATDLNQPMLDRNRMYLADDPRLSWRTADALALPFDAQGFDVVAAQFGAMFFPDKVKGYSEARRVLRDGGHLLFNVWDDLASNEFTDEVTQAVGSVFPDDPPQFFARTPHGYHDAERIRSELQAAGFSNIEIEMVEHRSRASSPQTAATALCQGTPLRNEIEARDPARLQQATDAAAAALAKRFGEGAIEGRMRALVVTAST
jgi:ubiquinone/menaquinone biosynthesis C-methylase UbiE